MFRVREEQKLKIDDQVKIDMNTIKELTNGFPTIVNKLANNTDERKLSDIVNSVKCILCSMMTLISTHDTDGLMFLRDMAQSEAGCPDVTISN